MKLKNQNAGTFYRIKGVSQPEECQNCKVCLKLRMMELGLMPGAILQLNTHNLGLWVLNILSENGVVESSLALREDEAERILLEDDECLIKFEPV